MTQEPAALRLRRLVDGFQVSQAIAAAAALGVADTIADGVATSGEVAATIGADAGALYRLLRALASVGVLDERPGRRFALTDLGQCLRSDAPEPVGDWAIFISRPYLQDAWAHLTDAVRSGENAFMARHDGMRVWEWRAEHPEESAVFDRAMRANSLALSRGYLEAYDFGKFEVVADIGGGNGAMLTALLSRHAAMRGVLFDQPHVVERAQPVLAAAGVADRCQVVGGSFFDAVPAGADAYILKHVLHDWEDDECVRILRSVRASSGTSPVLVLEWVVGAANEDDRSKFSDLNMLVMPGGRERTADEWRTLLDSAGFTMTGVFASGSGHSVVEASPA